MAGAVPIGDPFGRRKGLDRQTDSILWAVEVGNTTKEVRKPMRTARRFIRRSEEPVSAGNCGAASKTEEGLKAAMEITDQIIAGCAEGVPPCPVTGPKFLKCLLIACASAAIGCIIEIW